MKNYDIYTDGSHLKFSSGRLGAGGVLIDSSKELPIGKKLDEFSIELLPEYMKMSYGSDKISNPTAELMAVLLALQIFGKNLKDCDMITIHADYLGVKEWMTGGWKIREPYIQRIKNDIDSEINKLNLQGKIMYSWVKGHQKSSSPEAYWNNYVDRLATGKKE